MTDTGLPCEVRLPAGAPHADWLRLRNEGIGASEIGMALGVSDWGGPLALWHRKRFPEPWDRPEPTEGPFARGHALEPVVLQMAAEARGFQVAQDGRLLRSLTHPWMQATLDSLVSGAMPGEAKSTTVFDRTYEGGIPPLDHQVQVQQQLAVLGAPMGYLFTLDVMAWRLSIFELQRDDQVIGGYIIPGGTKLWNQIEANEPPPPDPSQESLDAYRKLTCGRDAGKRIFLDPATVALVDQWEIQGKAKKEAEDRHKELGRQLEVALGDATFGDLPDGRQVKGSRISVDAGVVQRGAYEYMKLTVSRGKKGH